MTTRRDMLRGTALLAGAAVFGSASAFTQEERRPRDRGPWQNAIYARMLNWRIGPQFFSFNRFSFEESIQKCKATGARSFEIFQGQRLFKDKDGGIGVGISKENMKLVKAMIAEAGVVPHAMGVCGAGRGDFDFAAELGMTCINSEPGFNQLEEISNLADEYKISVGLHNHPKDSIYWNPDTVLEQLKNCGSRIGACCDTGHWLRSGLDPLECVKKLRGKIVSFHIKDLDNGHRDVPLGKGECKIADILKELADARFQGNFSIEYESDWDNNVPQITEGVQFFNAVAKEIVTE